VDPAALDEGVLANSNVTHFRGKVSEYIEAEVRPQRRNIPLFRHDVII
jgi:hypothetical protein